MLHGRGYAQGGKALTAGPKTNTVSTNFYPAEGIFSLFLLGEGSLFLLFPL